MLNFNRFVEVFIGKIMLNQISIITVQEIRSNDEGTDGKVSRDVQRHPNYRYMLRLVTIIALTCLCLATQSLIPRHNSIYYPNYWYETTILAAVVGSSLLTMRSMLEFVILTKEKSLVSISVGLKMFAIIFLSITCIFILSRVCWTSLMGLQHPMPFLGICSFFVAWFLFICALRFGIVFPSELRMNDVFRHKIRKYLMFDAWWLIISFQTDLLSFGFKIITGYTQCLFALLIPLVKEMNKKILVKLMTKLVGNNDEKANVLLSGRLNIHFALFVAIRMNGAEDFTIASVVFVDFVLQSMMVFQIIKLEQQVTTDGEEGNIMYMKKQKEVLKLLMAEFTEGLVPICYAIAFAMAYYGPNAYLTGNVLSDIWQYEKVKNIKRLFYIQGTLFGIDVLCVVMNTFFVSKFGNVDLPKQFCKLINTYWVLFSIQIMNSIFFYFAMNDINAALDMTLKFEWITDEGRIKLILNATDLTDNSKAILLANSSFN